MTKRSFCSTEFTLPAGEYVVKIRVKAIDKDHDQFYLTVGTKTVQIQPTVYNTYAYCDQSIVFSLSAPTKGYVQFATFPSGKPVGETGMLVDMVRIWKIEKDVGRK